MRSDVSRLESGHRGGERRVEQCTVLTACAMLRLWVCCSAPSDCVYFFEGRFASGSPGMNGELISPTESSQSLRIYSPTLQWPLPSRANNGTLENSMTQSKALYARCINTANTKKKKKTLHGGISLCEHTKAAVCYWKYSVPCVKYIHLFVHQQTVRRADEGCFI